MNLSDGSIPYIPLTMWHEDVSSAPFFSLPAGYSFRLFRDGDESRWAAIAAGAGEFGIDQDALEYFADHFAGSFSELPRRCILLFDPAGVAAGTATGWFADDDASVGRLHWVVIAREYQGRGLCRPLVAEAMRRMAELGHKTAMLTTQPKSWKGIRVYKALGWNPLDDGSGTFKDGWDLTDSLIRSNQKR